MARPRSGENLDSVYQRLPQVPPEEVHTTGNELQVEDEEVLAEEFVSQEASVSADSRIQWIHFILGCAVLLPWNVMITATPYFLARLSGSPFKSTFSSYLTTTFTLANFGFLAHATMTSKQSSNERRILVSILFTAIMVAMLTLSTFVHIPAGLFFGFVLLNGIAQAAAGSYLQTAVVAVASLFGPTAMQAVMSGQAAVAVAVSLVQAISAYASVRGQAPSEAYVLEAGPEERSAFFFFGLSTIFLLISAGAQTWLVRLPAYKAIVGQFKHIKHVVHGDVDDGAETSNLIHQTAAASSLERRDQIIRVAKENGVYNFAVAYVFIITLAVFPSITLSILPTNPSTHPLVFSAVHFLVFSVGDFFGRYMCAFPRLTIWSANRLLTLSLCRTLFIPIFLMCNIQRPSVQTSHSAIISSDILYMFILLLLGLSNGWISSLCMMAAPSVQHNPRLKGRVEDVDVAATVASFCLIGGLFVGSFASFAVRAAVCDCSPFRN